MRIVAGKYGGKRLAAPKGMATRPTTDRTRESLFNILTHKIEFDGIRVIDLFAGTGALGLEALSRGAGFSLFIEEANSARAAIRTNVEKLAVMGNTKIFRRDATKLGSIGKMPQFDIAFMDPPYGKGLGEKCAKSLLLGNWLKQNALIVLEEASEAFPEVLNGYELLDLRKYGESTIGLFECHPDATI